MRQPQPLLIRWSISKAEEVSSNGCQVPGTVVLRAPVRIALGPFFYHQSEDRRSGLIKVRFNGHWIHWVSLEGYSLTHQPWARLEKRAESRTSGVPLAIPGHFDNYYLPRISYTYVFRTDKELYPKQTISTRITGRVIGSSGGSIDGLLNGSKNTARSTQSMESRYNAPESGAVFLEVVMGTDKGAESGTSRR